MFVEGEATGLSARYRQAMGRMVDVDDLVDANEVATMLGLSRGSAVSVYQARYSEMPRPVVSKGDKKARLWLRSELLEWMQARRSES